MPRPRIDRAMSTVHVPDVAVTRWAAVEVTRALPETLDTVTIDFTGSRVAGHGFCAELLHQLAVVRSVHQIHTVGAPPNWADDAAAALARAGVTVTVVTE